LERLHDSLELEKSGKHKFAFSWNLLGGAPTQGHGHARKEIPLLGAAARSGAASTVISHLSYDMLKWTPFIGQDCVKLSYGSHGLGRMCFNFEGSVAQELCFAGEVL
jgi:hypothetical protein